MPPRTAHVSIDDVLACLRELGEGGYASVWDHAVFRELRRLHVAHGAVISLYLFFGDGRWDLTRMPASFAPEFGAASSWLRFGFHGLDRDRDYGGAVHPAAAKEDYERVVREIERFAGAASLDRVPRIHTFAGTRPVVRAWREARHGVVGLLTADDDRERVYYLDERQRRELAQGRPLRDEEEGLLLIPSAPRLEWTRGGNAPDDGREFLCLFTHEPYLRDDAVLGRIESACDEARRSGRVFAFPQDGAAA